MYLFFFIYFLITEFISIEEPTLEHQTDHVKNEERKEKHTQAFRDEYLRICPKSSDDFDHRRQSGVISWRGLAPYYNVSSWHKLLHALDLPVPKPTPKERVKQKFKMRVTTDLDFEAMVTPKWRYYK